MPEQIFIGNFSKGLKTDRLPFNIDNDAFPTMFNFYSWRGRAKRKRGTSFLGQLAIPVQSVLNATPPASWQVGQIALVNGQANLFVFLGITLSPNNITNITQAASAVVTIVGHNFILGQVVTIINVVGMIQINGGFYTITNTAVNTITLNVNSTAFTAYGSAGNAYLANGPSIAPGSLNIIGAGGQIFTEPTIPDGTLKGNSGGNGTINYATGQINIFAAGGGPITGTFAYFPGNPVMALADFIPPSSNLLYPLLLAFDTTNSYQISGNTFYNTTFYVNATGKTNVNPFEFSGQNYQQFWTTNYSSALWATNNKPGLHVLTGSYVSGSPGTMITFNFQLNSVNYANLQVGDVLWFNEWTSAAPSGSINKITGVVSNNSGSAAGNYIVTFLASQTVSGSGIVQVLNNSIPTINGNEQDGIRYYTGDPTGIVSNLRLPAVNNFGWVNFAPPLTNVIMNGISIDSTPQGIYYLVGALAILPFKDRLLFFSPWIQTSGETPIQLTDTVLWSWNGTPYYATTDSGPTPAATANIVPLGEVANFMAYYVDQTGLGGYLPAGIPQPIATVSNNEDVLLIGFGGDGRKTRFVYTGNDLQPFLFFNINSELPSQSTFSAVALDKGVIDIGQYGFAMTDQQSSQRIDLDIPDSVFQIAGLNFGAQRVNSIRDFFREWIYFCYPVYNSNTVFPTQTFLFNYRDNTWGILYENFTAHGTFRAQSKKSWLTLNFKSWNSWTEPWNSGSGSPEFPSIIGGTPEGYVLIKSETTGESISGTISALQTNLGFTQITSYNHCVSAANQNTGSGDYLLITGCLGTTSINGLIGKVITIIDVNNFVIDLPFPIGTYLGLGKFTRLSQPLLQTKQFPVYWQEGRQVRLGVQKYLMDSTNASQVTLNIYLSQDPSDAWNNNINNPPPNSLIYSQLLYTCPESTNIGLTPANTNLQMTIADAVNTQKQLWHRINTSLIGDSFQIGITLNDSQMRNIVYATDEIALHGIQLTVDRGPQLA